MLQILITMMPLFTSKNLWHLILVDTLIGVAVTNGASDNHSLLKNYWSLYNIVVDSIQCYVAHFTACTFPLCKQPLKFVMYEMNLLFSLIEKQRRLSHSDQTKVKMVARFSKD